MHDARVDLVFDNAVDCSIRKTFPVLLVDVHFGQIFAESLRSVALMHILIENEPDDFCCRFIQFNVKDFFVALVCPASFHKPVPIRHRAACK